MITKQLEKEGAQPTLLDPLEVGAPLLAQPLHFMVSFFLHNFGHTETALWSSICEIYRLRCRRTRVRPHNGCWILTRWSRKVKGRWTISIVIFNLSLKSSKLQIVGCFIDCAQLCALQVCDCDGRIQLFTASCPHKPSWLFSSCFIQANWHQ